MVELCFFGPAQSELPRFVLSTLADMPLKVETVGGWVLKDLAGNDNLRSTLLQVGYGNLAESVVLF